MNTNPEHIRRAISNFNRTFSKACTQLAREIDINIEAKGFELKELPAPKSPEKRRGRPPKYLVEARRGPGRPPKEPNPLLRLLKTRKSGFSVSDIAQRMNWEASYASIYTSKLAREGLVEKVRDGQKVMVRIKEQSHDYDHDDDTPETTVSEAQPQSEQASV